MRLAQLVPPPLKEMIKDSLRYNAIRRAMRPLKERGTLTDAEVAALYSAWQNRGFAGDTAYLRALLDLLTRGPVLECGTGITTLIENELGNRHGFKTYALEQDREWGMKVTEWKLDAARVIDAPLKSYGTWMWYDVGADLPSHFALIVCDGPYIDKSLGEPVYSAWRYGLLPWLKKTDRTFDCILFDDVNDPRGPGLLERWQTEFGVSVERVRSAVGELAILKPA